MRPDSDGKLRRIPLLMESGDRQYPSLALAAFDVYRRISAMQLSVDAREASRLHVAAQSIRLEGRSTLRLRFRGAPGRFRTFRWPTFWMVAPRENRWAAGLRLSAVRRWACRAWWRRPPMR